VLDAPTLQRAMSDTLAQWADAGLTLIAVDDAHYADEATLVALPALVVGAASRVAWIVGCRVSEMPPVLADWIGADDAEALIDIRLAPLDRAAVGRLLQSLDLPGLDVHGWTEPLLRHTGGNPMFILETLRAVVTQGDAALTLPAGALPAPVHIGELIGRRLQQLSAGALSLARIAAIAGEDFSAGLAAHALGRAVVDLTDDWIELEAAQVIKDGAFAHDLINEVTLRSLPGAIARALHASVAAFLQSKAAPAARVAAHWREAREWLAAAAAFEAAADQALRASRREDELQLIGQAVECARAAGDRSRLFQLQLRSVDALLIVKPVDVALALTDRLLADATSDEQRLEALLRRASALLMASEFAAAVTTAQAARALACELGATARELDAVRFEALGLANSGRAAAAVQMLRENSARFERDGGLLHQYQFATDLGHALGLAGVWREAIGAMTRAVELAQRLDDVAETIVNLTNLAGASGYVGRMGDAVARAEQARALRIRLGAADGAPMAHNDMILGMLYVALGRYREALQAFAEAEQQFRAGARPCGLPSTRITSRWRSSSSASRGGRPS
jgi:tetratricopeptide (TPR) repeat protein